MRPRTALDASLEHLRAGRYDEAGAIAESLATLPRMRFEMALAYKRGKRAQALELAETLWSACAADPTVMAILVEFQHPILREAAGEMLRRFASDSVYDVGCAWQRLAKQPADLDAWRDVISHLIVTGRSVDAVAGIAHALAERLADFDVWALLATLQLNYRQRDGLLATVDLGRRAFPDAPEMRATTVMIFLGLGDADSAQAEISAIRAAPASPLVLAAREAFARVRP